jgi:HEAT repeat protein
MREQGSTPANVTTIKMNRFLSCFMVARLVRAGMLPLLALGAGGTLSAAEPVAPARTRELVAVVQSGDLAARARALQQLAVVGSAEAVPVLAGLLADPQLGQYARDGLEQMPDAAAGAALRAALERLEGRFLIGVVNSLGVRRDVAAVPALGRLATDPASPAAVAAMLALGRIGTPAARQVIEPALRHAEPALRAAAAEAAVLLAERLAREQQGTEARRVFEAVRNADVPGPLRVAAVRGAILAGGADGLKLLVEQLRSNDPDLRDLALRTARELRDPKVTPVLEAELEQLSPPLQAAVLTVLADRADPGALAAVEARALAPSEAVRLAALRALGTIGRASSVPLLLQTLRTPGSEAVATVALASLGRIPARETNAAILRVLPGVPTELRVRLIGVLGERRADEATGPLLQFAAGSDLEPAKAALRALGQLARPADLPRLIALAVAVRDEDVKILADRAIVTTTMKVLEPERRAEAVLQAFQEASDPVAKAGLLRPLGAIMRTLGGSHEVFFHVRAALAHPAEPVRAAALTCLADWPEATPATTLLEVAAAKDVTPAQRETALRGALRMATQVAAGRERSPLNVLEVFRRAAQIAQTREERMMLVSGLGSVRRVEAVQLLQPFLDDPEVKAEAALAVVQAAAGLGGPKNLAAIKPVLERIAATAPDEDVRRRAARLARGEAAPAAKGGAPKAGKAGKAGKAAPAAAGATAAGPLFNGRDLANWDGDPGVWRVAGEAIVGGSRLGNPRNEFLATTRRYRDFVLRLEYKLTGTGGFVNGGVQVRSERVAQPPNEMSGYQADIGAGHSGSLYDESRRKKFLARADEAQVQRLEKPGDWNRYEIRCVGPRVEISLNGERTLSYTEEDASVAREGLIALQIHGNCQAEIAFRHLAIEEL